MVGDIDKDKNVRWLHITTLQTPQIAPRKVYQMFDRKCIQRARTVTNVFAGRVGSSFAADAAQSIHLDLEQLPSDGYETDMRHRFHGLVSLQGFKKRNGVTKIHTLLAQALIRLYLDK